MCKFGNFSATQILREISFEDWRRSKTAMFADSEALNLVFGKFQPSKFANNHQNLILEPQNCQNGYFSNFWNPKNRFHVKSEW